jgi:hypothetical protein
MNRKNRLLISLSLILVAGFLATGLVSYYLSYAFLRDRITGSSLPLTSDNVFSEIQRDLLRPVFMASMMANDTFLQDWVTRGEADPAEVARYLKAITEGYGTVTSFFVSEATRTYYHADGILKTVNPDSTRDRWYFRVRDMEADREINLDPDLANRDALTLFVNHKVRDENGRFIGATGVGLTVDSGIGLMQRYRAKYGRDVFFVDQEGALMLDSESGPDGLRNIHSLAGIASIADQVLSTESWTGIYVRDGKRVYLNSRLIPDLGWHLMVEETEASGAAHIQSTLLYNLALWAVITAVVILLTALTINAYQKAGETQQVEILRQHRALTEKNTQLEQALGEVKKLSGLLPICASCKKVRDDGGYWQQIEAYVRDHSEADFSHGICPECYQRLYPEYADE